MFKVIESSLFCTVQDLGRRGWQRFGVPVAGAMDTFALAAGNRLVGNPAGAAGVEISLGRLALQAQVDVLVAGTGCGYTLWVDDEIQPAWTAVQVRRGSHLRLEPQPSGGWGYLAVAGGVDVPLVMDSRSTYLRGGFGGFAGRSLQPGDNLPVGAPLPGWLRLEGCYLPADRRPAYSKHPVLRVLLAPDLQAFTLQGIETFLSSTFRVGVNSDRMGCRLEGPVVTLAAAADILSEGLAAGMVQVPLDGQPIVLMSDCQTTGGYARIGSVSRADLPLMAQCPPGAGEVRFRPVALAEAQHTYRQQQLDLDGRCG